MANIKSTDPLSLKPDLLKLNNSREKTHFSTEENSDRTLSTDKILMSRDLPPFKGNKSPSTRISHNQKRLSARSASNKISATSAKISHKIDKFDKIMHKTSTIDASPTMQENEFISISYKEKNNDKDFIHTINIEKPDIYYEKENEKSSKTDLNFVKLEDIDLHLRQANIQSEHKKNIINMKLPRRSYNNTESNINNQIYNQPVTKSTNLEAGELIIISDNTGISTANQMSPS